jgi:hypothetical protein
VAIPEEQLNTWSKQGSVPQSAETGETIKNALKDPDAPYHERKFDAFLQGSYGNSTNVYGVDSDVDVVMKLSSVFYYNLDSLSTAEQELFRSIHGAAAYGYTDWKRDVTDWLASSFGSDVDPGEKAVRIKARNNRRDADVLPCVSYRKYYTYNGTQADNQVVHGITFFKPDGTQIVNYPRLHREHCIAKHQATNGCFKAMVRIFKNMRNRLRNEGEIDDGLAPSYYLEGMLYNVPNGLFGGSYAQTFLDCFRWLQARDKSTLVCANEQVPLFLRSSPTSWDIDEYTVFMGAIAHLWDTW